MKPFIIQQAAAVASVVDNQEVLLSIVLYDMLRNRIIQLKLRMPNVLKLRNRATVIESFRKNIVQSLNLRHVNISLT